MRAFQAYAGASTVTRPTPRQAALAFFAENPNKRKCRVIEGEVAGPFFTVSFGRRGTGDWPLSWKDVTKKGAVVLPDTEDGR